MFSNFKMHPVKNCFKPEIGTVQMSQQESTSGRKESMIGIGKAGRYIHWRLVRASEIEMH